MVGVVIVDASVLAVVVALLRFEKLPHGWRASVCCALIYAIGVTLLISVGASRPIYLCGFSILTTLLLGQHAGLGASLIASISLLLIGVLGISARGMSLAQSNAVLANWAVVSLNFALVNILSTLAIGSVLRTLENALKREIGTRTSLERTLLRALARNSR